MAPDYRVITKMLKASQHVILWNLFVYTQSDCINYYMCSYVRMYVCKCAVYTYSPVFDGLFDFCSMYTGASLEAAYKLNNEVRCCTVN